MCTGTKKKNWQEGNRSTNCDMDSHYCHESVNSFHGCIWCRETANVVIMKKCVEVALMKKKEKTGNHINTYTYNRQIIIDTSKTDIIRQWFDQQKISWNFIDKLLVVLWCLIYWFYILWYMKICCFYTILYRYLHKHIK